MSSIRTMKCNYIGSICCDHWYTDQLHTINVGAQNIVVSRAGLKYVDSSRVSQAGLKHADSSRVVIIGVGYVQSMLVECILY